MNPNLPALSIPLQGRALIEASAGTGKTWTLTAMVLRLLLEAERPARQMIATTFTRKAAAEMKRRIQQSLWALLQQYEALSALEERQTAIEALPDPLWRHLFGHHQRNHSWERLGGRLKMALQEWNQMFIGTLDALCQRWLSEYALETGSGQKRQLLQDERLGEALTHDGLRLHYQNIWQEDGATLGEYLQQSKTTLAEMNRLAQEAVDFSRSQLDPVHDDAPDAAALEALKQDFQNIDWEHWAAWTEALLPCFPANRNLVKYWSAWHDLWQAAQNDALPQGHAEKLLQGLLKPSFKKNQSDEAWLAAEATLWWPRWAQQLEQRKKRFRIWQQKTLYASIHFNREHLPQRLAQTAQTTFGEDWRRLNSALQDVWLPQFIRHRYPVMLVDESQDLNGEQSAMLERIYFNDAAQHDAFLLLVGDPKQSIYRFRGGETLHYQRLKKRFSATEIHALLLNRRSSPALLAALNHHYRDAERLGEGIVYQNVSALESPRPLSDYQGRPIQKPLIWLDSAGSREEEAEQISELLRMLLRGDALFAREGKRLQARDILILAKKNQQLQTIAEALQRVGIEAELQDKNSIFQTAMAQNMSLLLQALLQPRDISAVHALMSSLFFQYHWQENAQHPARNRIQSALEKAESLWQRYGLLSALHHFLSESGAWERLAQLPQGLRHLVDLRALLPLLGEHSTRLQPSAFFSWWLGQLEKPSQAEWAQAPSLPTQNAVRLMTIHKAKGLQAPIVMVAGLGQDKKKSADALQLKRYSRDELSHIAVGDLQAEEEALWEQEERDEEARLLYVALTRAEDLLFILRRPKNGLPCVEALWEGGLAAEAQYWTRIPEGQDDVILPLPQAQPEALPKMETATRSHHYGWHRTSFTALSRGKIDHHSPESEQEALQESFLSPVLAEVSQYRFSFPRGTQAGSFLHILLERLKPHAPQHWPREIERYAQRMQLTVDVDACMQWLREIYATPLHGSGLSLQQIQQRSPELGFMMRLRDTEALPLAEINALFAAYGKPLQLGTDARHYRYLRGEIDLVYAHAGRYYIVDYKSNYLGQDWQAYAEPALQRAMNAHQYWLQAAIYQLALYRRLRLNPRFAPEQLGGVEYLFLRGMHPEHRSCCFWSPPLDFLQELDALLL